MSEKQLSEWKETLFGYVFDESLVVTFSWLASKLDVHVNVSKQLLEETLRSHFEKLDAVYLVAGTLKRRPSGTHVKLVRQNKLVEGEEEFDTITSKHVYAVAKKTEQNKLLHVLGVLNVDMSPDACLHSHQLSIQNKNAVARSNKRKLLEEDIEEEIDMFADTPPRMVKIKPVEKVEEKPKRIISSGKPSTSSTVAKKGSTKHKSSSKQASIMNFFNKK